MMPLLSGWHKEREQKRQQQIQTNGERLELKWFKAAVCRALAAQGRTADKFASCAVKVALPFAALPAAEAGTGRRICT